MCSRCASWRWASAACRAVGLAAGPQIGVEAAGIERQLAAVEMQGRRRRGVEQLAVVADQDKAVAIAAQIALEPQRGFEVEMVGRLVEQQQVGLGEQHRRQRHPHAPAARQFVDRGCSCIAASKPSPARMRAARAGAARAPIVVEPRLDLGDAQRRRRRLRARPAAGALAVGGEHRVERRRRRRSAPPAPESRCGSRAAGRCRRRPAAAGRGSGRAGSTCRRRCGRPARACCPRGSARWPGRAAHGPRLPPTR